MKIVIANFKSHKSPDEYRDWIQAFHREASLIPSEVQVVLAPSFPSLSIVSNEILNVKTKNPVKLAVQDLSPYPAGSYTGAVSFINIKGLQVEYSIVGHSERRQYFHETHQDVANKVHLAIENGIVPIVCVTKDEMSAQANALEPSDRNQVMVAFEPVEHIGTGTSDTLENILESREFVKKAFGDVSYIYGGSVHDKTDASILTHTDIDGFLVGSASLDARAFSSLLSRCT